MVFLSRLYIATLLGQPTDGIIERQLSVCVAQLEKIRASLRTSRSPVEKLTLEYVAGQLDSAIQWLKHCREYPLIIPDQTNTHSSSQAAGLPSKQ